MHTIQSISELIRGTVEGPTDFVIKGVNGLIQARAGELSYLQEMKFEKHLYKTRASAVLIPEEFVPKKPLAPVVIRVTDVGRSLIAVLDLFKANNIFEQGNEDLIHIGEDVKLAADVVVGNFTHLSSGVVVGEGTRIGSQVFLGKNVNVGKHVTLYPGVKIYHGCTLGDNCIVHSNAVIGSDGFGFNPGDNGRFQKVPQVGSVLIENDVEIGANTVIDRSTFGQTIIRSGVKLDNLIQVAHNVEIGENTVIAAQSGISGSVKLGRNCIIGGQVAFAPRIQVADGSQFQGKSGVGSNLKEPGGKYYGYPAIGFNDYIRSYSVFKVLPQLEKRVRELEKALKNSKKE